MESTWLFPTARNSFVAFAFLVRCAVACATASRSVSGLASIALVNGATGETHTQTPRRHSMNRTPVKTKRLTGFLLSRRRFEIENYYHYQS